MGKFSGNFKEIGEIRRNSKNTSAELICKTPVKVIKNLQ